MTMTLVQAGQFRGVTSQPLRNVLIYAPTIIWVNRGYKKLWWQDDPRHYTQEDWLVVPASHYLTFVNEPSQTTFYSRTLTFLEPPPSEWLEDLSSSAASASNAVNSEPRVSVTPQLAYCFDTLYEMAEKNLAADTQRQFLHGFYAELKAAGSLHLLFPSKEGALKEQLASYLSLNPGDAHSIDTVATHFSMSPATLKRKLASEETSFRQVLTNIRMVYALSLMQKSRTQLNIALACGYQSEVRFASRFKDVFGVTPKQYVQTL
ncbi:AraC family transcriptional regulator [Enterovibrio norvegicus FF-33]|uniref:helix-turn-helix transcriptional regulator n=1 Tax=Enterovibrio TaxID=188143 RepID=UPI0002E73D66|nr:AraC family transcriptional regulator [Enterovibrio norvegicus]OEE70384.1 AraC family transcriptional regulator [Enterovibrio norvegicus FF-33]